MKGSVIINGVDIADFGVFILRGGDYDFLPFPDRKEPTQNNWFEQDGLDVDLSEVYFKERTVAINFYISSNNARSYEANLNGFYRLITQGYISLYSREFSRTFVLRYLSVTEYNHKGGLYKQGDKRGWFKIDFSMDDPLQLFTDPTIIAPRLMSSLLATDTNFCVLTDTGLFIELGDILATSGHISHVSLNGYDLGQFGIIVNECYSSILQLPAIKAPLTRSFDKRTGLLVPSYSSPEGRSGGARTFEAKEIVIKCTMIASSKAEFYYNYEALFNNLSKTGALEINSYLGRKYCYYSKMGNFKKMGIFSRGVMVSFTLRLMQIDAGLTFYTLGATADTAMLTDNQQYILM